MLDRFAFLDPWWMFLPEGGAAVISVVGSGGRSTLLRRLHDHYVARDKRVLWTQTVNHPAPFDVPVASLRDSSECKAVLDRKGSVFLANDDSAGLSPEEIELLRGQLSPDIVLVDAHDRCAAPLRRDGIEPRWPLRSHLVFAVGSLAATGRLWNERSVAGVSAPEPATAGEEPRRVTTDDIVDGLLDGQPSLLDAAASAPLVVPFLTGFGSFRDMDGMFGAVMRLCAHQAVRVVCLAELLGDERRDAADRLTIPENSPAGDVFAGERVYAVYPAELDETDAD